MFRVRDAQGRFKYTGRAKARVIDNRDPEQRGRVQVRHPLLGDTVWIDFLRDPNKFDMPSIGDIVFIEADSGEAEFPVAYGTVTKTTENGPELPIPFLRDIPTNRGLFTPFGHLVELDDGIAPDVDSELSPLVTTKSKGIRVTSSAGNKIHISEDKDNGVEYILIEDTAGNNIRLDTTNKTIDINAVDNYTNSAGKDYTIVANGNVQIQCVNAVVTASGNADINATGNANVTAGGDAKLLAAGDATVDGATIKLGTAAIEAVIKGDTFKALYNAHTHPYLNVAIPATTGIPLPMDASLSTSVKTK